MPYYIEKSLYTSVNPTAGDGPFPVVAEDAHDANFVLAGAGALVSDEEGKRLGLEGKEGVTQKSEADYLAEHDAKNRETHGIGQMLTSAPIKTPEPVISTTESPVVPETDQPRRGRPPAAPIV